MLFTSMVDMAAFMVQSLFHFASCFKYTFLISLISYLCCPVETSDSKINLPVWISKCTSVFIICYIKIKVLALVLLYRFLNKSVFNLFLKF